MTRTARGSPEGAAGANSCSVAALHSLSFSFLLFLVLLSPSDSCVEHDPWPLARLLGIMLFFLVLFVYYFISITVVIIEVIITLSSRHSSSFAKFLIDIDNPDKDGGDGRGNHNIITATINSLQITTTDYFVSSMGS